MTKAIRLHETGGPEVLKYEDYQPGRPGPGEVLLKQTEIGLNFIDVYFRTGTYPAPDGMPLIPGSEAAGIIAEVGEDVVDFKVGDRVAYVSRVGAYCQERIMPADRLVSIPENISDQQAASIMLKGMTAWYLLKRTFRVKAGDDILYHAAAGGVGLVVGQWAKHLGAIAIGTASSQEKIALAEAHGYSQVINYREKDFVAEVKALTVGKGCDVVYDSVGKDTFPGSLDCLRPMGMFVSFGQSSGAIENFNLGMLAQRGSLFATRPSIFTYTAKREDLETAAKELFEVIANGSVEALINQTYELKDAARAQSDLESRKTTGTTVLIP
jgi:NADPH2:quinone reductase